MPIYDITLPGHSSLACWPGDTPYDFRLNLQIRDGANINLGSMEMSVHVGSHADAPFHFDENGATIEALSLDPYIGPAIVIDVRGRDTIRATDLAILQTNPVPRVLLKTDGWQDHSRFPESIPVMEPGVPTFLKAQGVILLGLDVPSVDALDSKDLPLHHELGACGIQILESLALAEVPEGEYELIALPLKLVGADGSPVRAILRSL
jgi:arylformamidase